MAWGKYHIKGKVSGYSGDNSKQTSRKNQIGLMDGKLFRNLYNPVFHNETVNLCQTLANEIRISISVCSLHFTSVAR